MAILVSASHRTFALWLATIKDGVTYVIHHAMITTRKPSTTCAYRPV